MVQLYPESLQLRILEGAGGFDSQDWVRLRRRFRGQSEDSHWLIRVVALEAEVAAEMAGGRGVGREGRRRRGKRREQPRQQQQQQQQQPRQQQQQRRQQQQHQPNRVFVRISCRGVGPESSVNFYHQGALCVQHSLHKSKHEEWEAPVTSGIHPMAATRQNEGSHAYTRVSWLSRQCCWSRVGCMFYKRDF